MRSKLQAAIDGLYSFLANTIVPASIPLTNEQFENYEYRGTYLYSSHKRTSRTQWAQPQRHTLTTRPRSIRELKIGLRVRFSNFKPVTFPESSFFMLVLGRESSSWDEMGMCRDNLKPEN